MLPGGPSGWPKFLASKASGLPCRGFPVAHAVPLGQELPSNYCQLLCIHGTSSSSSKLIWTLSGLVPRNPPSSFSFPTPKGSTLT